MKLRHLRYFVAVAEVDTYGHLIPGANVSFVDRLDIKPKKEKKEKEKKTVQPSATPAQPRQNAETEIPSEVADLFGGGVWTRTTDLRIMSRKSAADSKEDQ
jgi:hypothetical protein